MSEKLAIVVPVYNEPNIDRTLRSLYGQNNHESHHFIVDNGSTDSTREKIDTFIKSHDDMPLTIIEEDQKGTGAASDTGFRHAIEQGFRVIARTDGDSVPRSDWSERINANFHDPSIELLGGRSAALKDEYYRPGDDLIMPIAVRAARVALALKHTDGNYLKAVVGHNMATRSQTYQQVGGFERSSIDTLDEDIDYSLKIARQIGHRAIKIDAGLEVATSMRRIRSYGLAGTALHHLFPGARLKSDKAVDIR